MLLLEQGRKHYTFSKAVLSIIMVIREDVTFNPSSALTAIAFHLSSPGTESPISISSVHVLITLSNVEVLHIFTLLPIYFGMPFHC